MSPRPALYSSALPCCWAPVRLNILFPWLSSHCSLANSRTPGKQFNIQQGSCTHLPRPYSFFNTLHQCQIIGKYTAMFSDGCVGHWLPLPVQRCKQNIPFLSWHLWVTIYAPLKQQVEQRPLCAPQLFLNEKHILCEDLNLSVKKLHTWNILLIHLEFYSKNDY